MTATLSTLIQFLFAKARGEIVCWGDGGWWHEERNSEPSLPSCIQIRWDTTTWTQAETKSEFWILLIFAEVAMFAKKHSQYAAAKIFNVARYLKQDLWLVSWQIIDQSEVS